MFGHFKSEDFVNLIESGKTSTKQQAHLDECAQCRTTWESLRSVHAEFSALDSDIPEPDWLQFRSSVRDQLLSRSIQRDSAVRRWTGWAIRPAMAWALSVLLAVGVTTVTLLWKTDAPVEAPATVVQLPVAEAVDIIDSAPDRTLFDDLVQLGDEQQEQLQQMLERAQKEASKVQ